MTSSNPLVSIIMAAKDEALYIEQCLDSIVNQTYQNWELIAIDDHSSDATPEILESYAQKDKRIKVFHSERRQLIPTLKHGYQFVQGDLINRMDADDYMPLDKIETLVNEWLKYGKGHIIAGGTEHFVNEGQVGGGFLRYEKWLNNVAKNDLYLEQIYKECVIPSHCWIIHKEDFDAVGGFQPEDYPEDYDLCFRYYKHGLKIHGIDKILHYWRDHQVRISRTWDSYKDNRYYELKLRYFYQIDRDFSRPLVLWGAGRNGKDMAKLLLTKENDLHWVCDNHNKIGKDVYGITMQHFDYILSLKNPQIMIVVAAPDGQSEIQKILQTWSKEPIQDYWFFS
ncbi:MAG: glycosyltransferase [Flavobacteriales bacterium]|nr:glycosyltransferase [Flavobacteriales bacterium]